MKTIYIVEDDENIRDLVLYALNTAGFLGKGFEGGESFFKEMKAALPDLVLLDIMLPGDSGIAILKKLRNTERGAQLPVIMLTAKGSEYDRVMGLDSGADDYIVKPFSVLELLSRIKALLRRVDDRPVDGRKKEEQYSFKELVLDNDRHLVTVNGGEVTLTYKEFELLRYLMINTGIAISREKIMNHIWGYDFEGESRTVDMHIKTLRRKLGGAGGYIQTIRGVGYKLGE